MLILTVYIVIIQKQKCWKHLKGSTLKLAIESNKIGIQLYSLRDEMVKDPKQTLANVASFGYKYVEGYEGDQGLFWGMTNLEFKDYLDMI